MRILIVEDEARIADLIADVLQSEGYIAEIARDGEDGWEKGGAESYSAAILDIGLPRMDGTSVLRNWRKEGVNFSVLLLSAKSSWNERVEGIDAGADYYMVKPFQMEELLARLRALLRRTSTQKMTALSVGDLQLDLLQMRITLEGRRIKVTPLEFRLLSYLLHHKGEVVAQSVLAENIYFRDQEHDSNAFEVLIGRLRRKLGSDLIETKRGFGYVIAAAKV
jgi:two-component system OmpR family response regulator